MKLTKYEHACFTVESEDKLLVIDPGVFTHDIGSPENVVAIVVTHEHPDHFDTAALGALVAHNPNAIIYAPVSVTQQLGDALPHHAVTVRDVIHAGPFMLEFFGGNHAVIHSNIPTITNLGMMINDKIYYAGDSFLLPNKPVDTLALPVGAPWLKLSETLEYLQHVKPRFAFPTHDAILSEQGKSIVDTLTTNFAKNAGVVYQRLHEPIEV